MTTVNGTEKKICRQTDEPLRWQKYIEMECFLSLLFNERFHMAFVQNRNNLHSLLSSSPSFETVKQHSIINALGICHQPYPFSLAVKIDVLHHLNGGCVGTGAYHCHRLNRLQPTSYQNANCIVTTHNSYIFLFLYTRVWICSML